MTAPSESLAASDPGSGRLAEKKQWTFEPEEGGIAALGWLEGLLFALAHQLPLSLSLSLRTLIMMIPG